MTPLQKLRSRLYWSLKVFVTPSCWFQLHEYSKEWDSLLTRMLDDGEHFTNIWAYEADLCGVTNIWIRNHPYASFTVGRWPNGGWRPARATILRAMSPLVEDLKRQGPM